MQVRAFENQKWQEKQQAMNFRLKTALAMIESGSVLDLGCGDGFLLLKLKEKGIFGKGLDISQTAIKKAKRAGLEVDVFDFAVNKLAFSDNAFDNVALLDVLEHLYQPLDVLKEASRVCRANVIIAVPNFNSLPARLQALLGRAPENNQPKKGHIYWFNHNVLANILQQTGLKVVEEKVNSFFSQTFILKDMFQALAKFFPNLFALSFVVKVKKI